MALFQPSQAQMKRLTAVHGWSGVVLGLLLYVVVFTGTVAVIGEEIGLWAQGGRGGATQLEIPLDAHVRGVVDRLPRGFQEEIGVLIDGRGTLTVYSEIRARHPQRQEVGAFGQVFRLDPKTGALLERHEGFFVDHPNWFQINALEAFLVDLHEELHLPDPWGRILTGGLGLLAMAAAISGLILHRHLIRDLFLAARPGARLASMRDRHLLAASWGLPFAFLLGFTGAFFGFGGPVLFPMIANVAFGGDRTALVARLFEPPADPDAAPAPLADLDRIIAEARDRARAPVRSLIIHRYGRADARLRLFHGVPQGALDGAQSVFDGASGRFLGLRPPVGQEPSLGASAVGLMEPLHFGDFAGWASKAVWLGLGSAMASVVVSGLRLWVRRRQTGRLWRWFGRGVTATAYGLPVAMLASCYGHFLALGAGADTFRWVPAAFLLGMPVALAPALLARNDDGARRLYRWFLAIGCLLAPVMRLGTGGLDWSAALADAQATVLVIDTALASIGAGLLAAALHRSPAEPAQASGPAG